MCPDQVSHSVFSESGPVLKRPRTLVVVVLTRSSRSTSQSSLRALNKSPLLEGATSLDGNNSKDDVRRTKIRVRTKTSVGVPLCRLHVRDRGGARVGKKGRQGCMLRDRVPQGDSHVHTYKGGARRTVGSTLLVICKKGSKCGGGPDTRFERPDSEEGPLPLILSSFPLGASPPRPFLGTIRVPFAPE